MKNAIIIIFILFISNLAYSGVIENYQYMSPVPGSELNSRQTSIIICQGSKIDAISINQSLIEVVGDQSGHHSGDFFLSDDERTILFIPHNQFAPDEIVTVSLDQGIKTTDGEKIEALSFSFKTTPLIDPIRSQETDETNLDMAEDSEDDSYRNSDNVEHTNVDSLPDDFPEFIITQNGPTAPGYLFGSSNSSVDSVGNYFMILENSGDPLFYSQTQSAGRLLSTGYFASASPLGPKHQYLWYIKDHSFNVVDSFQMGNGYVADNHDFILLPNGHAIMLAYDIQPIDMTKIIEGGRPDAQVTGSIIQELDVNKNVVYQWRCWDHIPIIDTYKDITRPRFDYIHVNSVELDHDGHIILSCRETSEVIKISRITGETIWRWGGKNNEFSILGDHEENAPRYFKLQHSVRRTANGNIIMFDNGADKNDKQRDYSRAVEYEMDEVNMTATMVWDFRHDPDILALTGGTVARFPNGNTSINWGGASRGGTAPAYTEVNPDGDLVYEIEIKGDGIYGNFSRYLWFDLDPTQIVTHYEIMEGNTYDFSEGDSIDTGVSIKINEFTGESYNELTVMREPYGPQEPQFLGRAPVVFPERINITVLDIHSINADFTLDLNEFDFTDPDSLVIFYRAIAGNGVFIPLSTQYNRVTNKIKATINHIGEFIVAKPDFKSMVYAPMLVSPADSISLNYTLGVNLIWAPVGYVNEYRVQVANDSSFLDLFADEKYLTTASLELDSLENDKTYFWRVQSINDAGASEWSAAGKFMTTSPYITLTVPNGDENWQVGLEYRIGWEDNVEENVILELLRNEELVTIIDTTSSNGSYYWEIDPDIIPGAEYKINIKSMTDELLFDMSDASFALMDTTLTAVKDNPTAVRNYHLYQNYPNPFNPVTHIVFDLPGDEFITLTIYDMLGHEVVTLLEGKRAAGSHRVAFDGHNFSSGLYFFKLETASFLKTRKMILMK